MYKLYAKIFKLEDECKSNCAKGVEEIRQNVLYKSLQHLAGRSEKITDLMVPGR
jgi:hypothetical protein